MMRTRLVLLAGLFLVPLQSPATAALWTDATESTIGTTGEWSNKVTLADVNADGRVDILFANGGNYSSAGSPQPNRVFLNNGPDTPFTEATDTLFGTTADLARVIKVRDVTGDGVADILVGTTYQTQSRLYVGQGDGAYVEKTNTHLPVLALSVGDLELGDVDGDGDLDAVLADWGPGNPLQNEGAPTRLWQNQGDGFFVDVTESQMPDVPVGFSWELELVDIDNDTDLDILVSCKSCSGSKLFLNDGAGMFTDASDNLPQKSNNYEFEAMDVDGDGYLDLVTINDGPGLTEHLFRNTGQGGFEDATQTLWPTEANVGKDDNVAVFLDADSDGDPDFLIGSLNGKDRLLVNDGTGHFTLDDSVFEGANTPGTLGMAVADLNDDGRLDVVQSQGEVASPDKVFFGTGNAVDTAPPVVTLLKSALDQSTLQVWARIHDHKSPTMPHDWQEVNLEYAIDGGDYTALPLRWYGESLWHAQVTLPSGQTASYRLIARDARGNETISESVTADLPQPNPSPESPPETDTDVSPPVDTYRPGPDESPTTQPTSNASSGGCSAGNANRPAPLTLLVVTILLALCTRRFFVTPSRWANPGLPSRWCRR
jgi:hypothetical protein